MYTIRWVVIHALLGMMPLEGCFLSVVHPAHLAFPASGGDVSPQFQACSHYSLDAEVLRLDVTLRRVFPAAIVSIADAHNVATLSNLAVKPHSSPPFSGSGYVQRTLSFFPLAYVCHMPSRFVLSGSTSSSISATILNLLFRGRDSLL
jgi:hypothetical protein